MGIRSESEDTFMRLIVQYAKLKGYLVYHTYDSRRSEAGFPDLTLVGKIVIFAEIKTDTGKLNKQQDLWINALSEAGAIAYVWRPRQWDFIKKLLDIHSPK